MSDTNNTLNHGPFVPPEDLFDPSTADLGLFNEDQLKAMKRDFTLRISDAEDELVRLDEAQNVRLESFNADWDGYLSAIEAEITRREEKLKADKAFLAARKKDRKADQAALEKEHKEARDILVATETLFRESLSSIKSALKALTKIKTRRDLSEYEFTPDTWEQLDDDEG